ncbi:hypothetical protein ONV78_13260 [Hahella sp. CR1]|nr:hypothetical protein [Hahella sp. CR1]MDG9668705.1 hypothetical protein [Hahella sp. CR1]
MWFVDDIWGLMRPLITVYLHILTNIVILNIGCNLGGVDVLSLGV